MQQILNLILRCLLFNKKRERWHFIMQAAFLCHECMHMFSVGGDMDTRKHKDKMNVCFCGI